MTTTAEDDRRAPPWMIAALVVAVLAAAVLGVMLLTRDDPTPTPTAVPTATGPDTTASSLASTAPAEPTGDPTGPGEWSSVEVAGLKLPVSAQSGPFNVENGRARGFAQTQEGAALAAAHIVLRVDGFATPSVFEPTIGEQVVAGNDAQRLLAEAHADYDAAVVDQGREDPQASATIRGYRISSFSDLSAALELWSEALGPNGMVRVAVPVTVAWQDDDWILVPPASGEAGGRQLTSTADFVEWPREAVE